MNGNEPREIKIPTEAEDFAFEHNREFFNVAVSTAKKPGFAAKYLGKPAQEERECYDCQYCRRNRYIKGEWPCAKFKPGEPPEGLSCFRKRENKPNCSECESWEGSGDYRCFCPGSWWAGKTTSPDNYCRFFSKRIPV